MKKFFSRFFREYGISKKSFDKELDMANSWLSGKVKIGSLKREDNESFDNYRERRKFENNALRIYLKGKYVWKSKQQGTR